jgi:multidrug resistance efflux pump
MPADRARGWPLARALALCAGALSGCGPSGPLPFAGFVDAPVAAVASQVAGRVEAIPVREGDRVRRGQLLAQIDAREREAQLEQAQALREQAREALKEARANLEAALPTVSAASADVARARATLDEAEANFRRAGDLAAGGAASPQQVDAARARFLEARAAWQSLGAARTSLQGRVAAARAAVANAQAASRTAEAAVRVAEVQVAQSRIASPFDGVVVSRNLEEGEWAAPGTPVVTVEDRTRLWVRIDADETAVGAIRIGGPAQIAVVALPGRKLRGHVVEVGAEGDFALNRDVKRGRPDVRTFRVRVAVDEAAEELRPGMTAVVTLRPAPPGPPGAAVGSAR